MQASRDRRAGRQPRRRSTWFQAARDQDSPRTISTSGRTRSRPRSRRTSSSRMPSRACGRGTRRRALVSPLLLVPTGSQCRQPARAGRNPEDRELLAAARRRRVPRRRSARSWSTRWAWKATRTQTRSTGSVSCARTSSGATAPASDRRSEPPAGRIAPVLRRRRRRRPAAVQLQPESRRCSSRSARGECEPLTARSTRCPTSRSGRNGSTSSATTTS